MKPEITRSVPKQLLTKASGFLDGYTHTLNPYAGCTFACSYCYVRQSPIGLFHSEPWGQWVKIKERAAEQLERELIRAKRNGIVSIFMASSTDPYQPLEFKERVMRGLLETMVAHPPDFLFIQTRGPMIVRDLDLLERMRDRTRISVTIETDLEEVRRAFTPSAPPVEARLQALKRLTEAGLPTQAAVSPVLPCSDRFAERLREVTDHVTLDNFTLGDGSGGKRTDRLNIGRIYDELGMTAWNRDGTIDEVRKQMEPFFDSTQIKISREGFLPPAEIRKARSDR